MVWLKIILSAALTIGIALSPGRADQAPQRLDLFPAPKSWFFSLLPDSTPDPKAERLKLIPNPVSECLPGKLYDARAFFEQQGVTFGVTDFAWYSVESQWVIVRASPGEVDLIETLLIPIYDPPTNIQLKGEVTVEPASGGTAPKGQRRRWDINARSGLPTAISSTGTGSLVYSCEMEPVIAADSKTIDTSINLKVTFSGREYAVLTATTMVISKPLTLLVGTTPEGDYVRFRITPELHTFSTWPPLTDARKKKKVLACIDRVMRKR